MPDLHAWITQQIDKVEAGTHSATAGPWSADMDDDTVFAEAGTVARMWDYVRSGSDVQVKADMGLIITHADPIAVLRRCAADRKILARHRRDPDTYWADRAMCQGCGTTGDCDWPVTDNLNDCPELLDLAEGYGLTPEILAGLDRPERGERPEPGPGFQMPDAIAEGIYGNLLRAVQATDTGWVSRTHVRVVDATPPGQPPRWFASPGEQAFAVVEPYLSAVALYKPDASTEA